MKQKIIRRSDGVEFVHSEGTKILLTKPGFALIELEIGPDGKRVGEVNISRQEFVGNEVALRQQIARKFPHLTQLIDRPDLCNAVLASLAQQSAAPVSDAPTPAAAPVVTPPATTVDAPPPAADESEITDVPGAKESTVAPLDAPPPAAEGADGADGPAGGGDGEPSPIDMAVAAYRGVLMNLTRDTIIERVAVDFPDADPVSGTKGAMSGIACGLLEAKLVAEAFTTADPA
jgi:hypothetical protein